ncbi:hypothetical protein PCANC_28154 [Puccinia coronata f. sp. avenae]|uniref:Uncharacterized protein n=1 Tax=Puccinia coronata f. sp. avenae TaxID=200324 RepID=A0A2N5THH7_9BASI|nr:hypothetical protein PCANC_28154 [Puccinia coronata f. sp. avenae]
MYLVGQDSKRIVVEAAIDSRYEIPDEPEITILEGVDEFTHFHPNLSRCRSLGANDQGGACTRVKQLAEMSDSDDKSVQIIAQVEGHHNCHPINQSLKSATTSLKRAVGGLKKKKDWNAMLTKVSVQTMNQFKDVCHAFLAMIEERCAGLAMTASTDFPGVRNTGSMTRSEIENLLIGLQETTCSDLKRASKLLQDPKHKVTFCKRDNQPKRQRLGCAIYAAKSRKASHNNQNGTKAAKQSAGPTEQATQLAVPLEKVHPNGNRFATPIISRITASEVGLSACISPKTNETNTTVL